MPPVLNAVTNSMQSKKPDKNMIPCNSASGKWHGNATAQLLIMIRRVNNSITLFYCCESDMTKCQKCWFASQSIYHKPCWWERMELLPFFFFFKSTVNLGDQSLSSLYMPLYTLLHGNGRLHNRTLGKVPPWCTGASFPLFLHMGREDDSGCGSSIHRGSPLSILGEEAE